MPLILVLAASVGSSLSLHGGDKCYFNSYAGLYIGLAGLQSWQIHCMQAKYMYKTIIRMQACYQAMDYLPGTGIDTQCHTRLCVLVNGMTC